MKKMTRVAMALIGWGSSLVLIAMTLTAGILFATGVVDGDKLAGMVQVLKEKAQAEDESRPEGMTQEARRIVEDDKVDEHLKSIELVKAVETMRRQEKYLRDRQERERAQMRQLQGVLEGIRESIDLKLAEARKLSLDQEKDKQEEEKSQGAALAKADLKQGLDILQGLKTQAAVEMLMDEPDNVAVQYLRYMDARKAGKIINEMTISGDQEKKKIALRWMKMLRGDPADKRNG